MSKDKSLIDLAILGAAGRMGRTLVAAAKALPGLRIAAGVDRAGADAGRDLGELAGIGPIGTALGSDAEAAFALADVAIDFTRPEATLQHAAVAARLGKALVIGTTGLDSAALGLIEAAAKTAPILRAANMSLGVTLLQALVRQAAEKLDESFDIEIVEMHHRMKVDAPSGTALALGEAAAAGRRVKLAEKAIKVRDGITGARAQGTIGFATLRGGDVVGDHTVIFAGAGERLELTHKASSRDVFAQGALRAALWLAGKPPGLYSMKDVLGIAS